MVNTVYVALHLAYRIIGQNCLHIQAHNTQICIPQTQPGEHALHALSTVPQPQATGLLTNMPPPL